ncbi:hypothetical protein [Pseudosporangium ferrugineum]|uniref:Uncharacterized protein n=1 Tax=Pseudosporangium ferrugineum TaxID=439699 RepID=A0A2T0RGD1_9ACTN|nr:hypothetical protein [Pseudosporangium ferrugineum]PRY20207.1 hypothetical protein CLV70_12588 [Pseudosporangium ferrugineum]
MTDVLRRADAGFVRILDGLVVFWVVPWVALAGWIGFSLWELADVGNTLVQSGQTLDSAGQALQRAGDIPLIGDVPEQLGNQVRTTAADIIDRGQQSLAYGRQLAVLLAVAVGLAPVVPVLLPYLPARLARRREAETVRRLLRDPDRRPSLDVYLAHRAVSTLPLQRMEALTADPWDDLTHGRVGMLAAAELARMGIAGDRASAVRPGP